MADLLLFWHRRDLRLGDNVGLAAARDRTPQVVGVFCLDPDILGNGDVAPARVAYMIGCLEKLQDSYAQAGGQLLILQGDPRAQIPALAKALAADAVYWNRDVEPYSRQRDTAVVEALKEAGIEFRTTFWDQLLHEPGDIRTGAGDPYTVYTPFWRNWVKRSKAAPLPTPEGLKSLTAHQVKAAKQAGCIDLPSPADLGFGWENGFPVEPGEQGALERLEEFCDGSQAIEGYDEQRNFPFVDGTSRLSAALKFGAVGIRTVWAAAEAAYGRSRSDETRNNVQTWQQELAWREFYQHVMYFFPELADGPYRQPLKDFPWDNNDDHFAAWCEGRTGYPIVDAAMRQLNEIGWMHNRCRMIVASFLTKDLIINWQWGEKYFMQHLVDGDLSANNGGWQWSASSGMDPKPLRIFNPASQAQKFDAEAEYIRQWVPELRSLDTGALVTGKIRERDRGDYPAPIVDHKIQQALFKDKYKAQRG
ncbi:FAD-binding domain-containing protein [Phormidium tenue]|uniref:Deoxyribodipyrimidine photolyase n=1 Tax=Phormidium tenue NIES-30 TaxID=549789 RepID=A0A1U7J0G9_9CYAN|nr:FAD-binding domain-containing protein [Phormidium tenue]MBD2234353.1 deoxyribodipyrimidine photo-lyase [Phormidium tenue FACHB-1052]OKH44994.1 deoxyribodipyrimidine photolyase [Phormidium tenue NIES-30]